MAVGPSSPALGPGEEEWKEAFVRLQKRFPTVPAHRVAQSLREKNGHAGEAAAILRDLTSAVVKEADPDDVEHVATLLSSPSMFKHACKEQFKKFDVNGDGVLEWEEVKALVNQIYEEFGLQLPSEGSLRAFFYATDENQDGVLSEREFRKFFEMFLRYAFFDHLKLRQMVEKGQAIEAKRNANGLKPGQKLQTDNDAEAGSSRGSSKSGSEKNQSKPSTPENLAEEVKPGKLISVPISVPEVKRPGSGSGQRPASGRKLEKIQSAPTLMPLKDVHGSKHRSPSNGGQERPHRSERPERTQQKERQSRQHAAELAAGSPQYLRCVGPNGVAFRRSPDYQDRRDVVLSHGSTVRVLEHWVRTPDGWLPLVDPQGQTLLERCETPKEEAMEREHRAHNMKCASIAEATSDDALSAEVRSSRSGVVSPSPPHEEAEGGGLRGNEEEWRPVFERLCQRFPGISEAKVAQALRDNDGHAGKAASMLRYI